MSDLIEDGHGSCWKKCSPRCGLEVVRVGKVQCWCDNIEFFDAPDMDAAVAEYVMGWRTVTISYPDDATGIAANRPDGEPWVLIRGPRGDACGAWMPSADTAAAMEVVAHVLAHSDMHVAIEGIVDKPEPAWWYVKFIYGHGPHDYYFGDGESLPRSICIAALRAFSRVVSPAPLPAGIGGGR